jgi:hypothetical protein
MKKLYTHYLRSTLIVLFFVQAFTYAQKQMGITSLVPSGPIVLNDTTDFHATLNIDSAGASSAVYGDLFYYYQTDSMINAGVPPRVIGLDGMNEWVYDGMIDIVPVDIRPEEIRTTPANLIILWPAMITNDSIIDTDSITINLILDEVMEQLNQTIQNLVYPNPIQQLLYINPTEIPLLSRIKVISQVTGASTTYYKYLFQYTGSIDLSNLPPGWYTVEVKYLLGLLTKYVTMYKL